MAPLEIRSAYIKAPWKCDVRNVPLASMPSAEWIRIRVASCGICGTDLTAIATKARNWEAVGHEVAGVIEAVGAGVRNLEVGQTVVLESASFCGQCVVCRNGRVDLCNDKAANFWGQASMGMSDQMLAPACCVVPYDGISPEEACLAEPCGVAYDMVRTANIQMGDRVCLVGPGPIGLAATALALHQGAAKILVVGRTSDRRRLEVAAGLGAEVLALDDCLTTRKDLHRQFEHVLMTAPTEFIAPGLELLCYGGEMTYIGIGTGDGRITFDANAFHFRKLQLRASFASPAIYFPAVLRLLKAGVIPGRKLISHVIPLENAPEAFRICREEKASVLKVIVKP